MTPIVRRMVMFKHGVAYLERGGPCDGAFELSFKKDAMNDVLKSLAVWVAKGEATVGAVAFEKPEDPEEALVRRRLAFDSNATLQSLFASLRGRRVAIDAHGTKYEGEVIGLERDKLADGADRTQIVLRSTNETLLVVDLIAVREVELREAPSRADLAFFVDRSRAATAGESRIVTVDVRGAAEDLRVSYVIPAPTWRVSYRIARAAGENEKATVMGWAIVHNPADEDLADIELTLTTGQPVSFVIDLYNPKNVHRAVVEEQSRAGSAPTQFERARHMRAAPGAPAPRPSMGAAAPRSMAFAAPAQAAYSQDDDADTGAFQDSFTAMGGGASTFEDRGELFEYKVGSRISLKRGGSAMVPLFASEIDGKKERIWRDGSGPSPDLVITFKNETGAVLEEGAAVVYDGSVYAGEAMVPYSARGSSVTLAFAKDLAVRVKHEVVSRWALNRVTLGARQFVEELRQEHHHSYSAESDHADPISLIIEMPKVAGRRIDPASPQPFEETASYFRFKLEIPPRSHAKVVVVEQWFERRTIGYESLETKRLEKWLEDKFLDNATFERLVGVLSAFDEARIFDARRAEMAQVMQAAWNKQAKISEQLKVLKDGGAEGQLRLRYVKELENEQNNVNAAEAEDRRLIQGAEASRARAQELLGSLA